MAKNETKTEPKVEEKGALSLEQRVAELEGRVLGLERRMLGVTGPKVTTLPGARARLTCANGHGMQATDDYCQTCAREGGSETRPGNSAA